MKIIDNRILHKEIGEFKYQVKGWGDCYAPIEPTEIRRGRCVGNTTRQVDRAIQMLYSGKTIICFDHFSYQQGEPVKDCNEHLFNRILSRLNSGEFAVSHRGYTIKHHNTLFVIKLEKG